MAHTFDERETFVQSNVGEPLAEFISVQLSETFGDLPVHILGRRSGYIPAADATFCMGLEQVLQGKTFFFPEHKTIIRPQTTLCIK